MTAKSRTMSTSGRSSKEVVVRFAELIFLEDCEILQKALSISALVFWS